MCMTYIGAKSQRTKQQGLYYKRYIIYFKKITMQGSHFINNNTHLKEVVHDLKVSYNCCTCDHSIVYRNNLPPLKPPSNF
jgi:hypothetical protein